MSHYGKPNRETGVNSLTDRFLDSFCLDKNKPDSKGVDPSSQFPPQISRGGGTTTSTSPLPKPTNGIPANLSGELLTSPNSSDSFRSAATAKDSRPGHRRSQSTGPSIIYSGGGSHHNSSSSSGSATSGGAGGGGGGGGGSTSVTSRSPIMYPSGNICPSGKILKSNMGTRGSSTRTETLGLGTGNYGHGSIVRGGGKSDGNITGNTQIGRESPVAAKRMILGSDPEELKRAGNELYGKGQFAEALTYYDRAISMVPENAAFRSNRGAALIMLGRLGEAVTECEEAVRLDSGYMRAHQRLVSLYLRLGHVENARQHIALSGQQLEGGELQKLLSLEKHLNRCADARKIGDWKSALRECDAAMMYGAVSSPQIVACKTEAQLKLHQLEDADSTLSNIPKLEPYPISCSQTKFFGMLSEAYVLYVQAKVDMALGRFENAVVAAEKAVRVDYCNIEVAKFLNNIKLVIRARAHGKELFDSGRYTEACDSFGEGLKYDLSNSVLYCNRAVCWSKLGLWEQSIADCNLALKIHPNYTKALLRRAASNTKLERWSEAVKDYEVLRQQLPGDNEVAECLQRAQAALKKLRREEAHNVKFAGDVAVVNSLESFKAAISSPGVSLVHFTTPSSRQCEQISPFVDSLCAQYPSVNFVKVNAEESPTLAKAEGVRVFPTFIVYKNREKVREMICPNRHVLESSVRQYIL